MKLPDINDLEPEEMEYAHVSAWERKYDADALDSDIPVPVEESQKYQNLWSSEDDPRAVPPPPIICPVHRLGCKKGICEDMSKMLRDIKRAELKAKWEKEGFKKNKGTSSFLTMKTYPIDWFFFFLGKKKKVTLGSDDEENDDAEVEVEVDKDNFAKAVTRPKGKKVQDDEPSFTGRMRAFPEDPVPSDDEPNANGKASGSAPEGQVFDQW